MVCGAGKHKRHLKFIEETLNDAVAIENFRFYNALAEELSSKESDHSSVVQEIVKHMRDISWRKDSAIARKRMVLIELMAQEIASMDEAIEYEIKQGPKQIQLPPCILSMHSQQDLGTIQANFTTPKNLKAKNLSSDLTKSDMAKHWNIEE